VLWGADFACLVLLGYLVTSLVLYATEPTRTASTVIPRSDERQQSAAREPLSPGDYKIIVERDIFGSQEAQVAAEPAEPVDATPAQPPLQLKLHGTIAGDPDLACAVIEDTTTKIYGSYKTGDVVQGAQIEKIERNRVVLMRGDQEEVLEVSFAETSARPTKSSTITIASSGQRSLEGAVNVISPTQFEINRRALIAKIGGVEAILRRTKVTPYLVDGEVEGLQINGLEGMSMARFVGLQDGDVIQKVNGQKLSSLQKAFQVFRKVRTQPSVNIELLRGDEKETLTFDMR
jgi:general secretion pathway protein C